MGIFGLKGLGAQKTNNNPVKKEGKVLNPFVNYSQAPDSFDKNENKPAKIIPVITNPLDREGKYTAFILKYVNNETISNAIEKNPNIKRLLGEFNLDCDFDVYNVIEIIDSHLIPCAKTAEIMFKRLGHFKDEEEYKNLIKAALLHDIGKVFIPRKILNKKGKLNRLERKIIELHNKLSYEILKTTNLNSKVAKLAYEHHNYDNDVKRNAQNQVLTISDCYCALREDRPYKKAMKTPIAIAILYDMATKGSFDARYIQYLNTPLNAIA